MAGLKSWRELLETPLREEEKTPEAATPMIYCETPETGGFPPSGVSQAPPMKNPCETPEKLPDRPSRLVRTGENTGKEAEWARGLCVYCPEPLAPGDVIACTWHRAQMDATVMPWEKD